jgi:hypothetical protein
MVIKLPHQTQPTTSGTTDVVTKEYFDANSSGAGTIATAQGDYLRAGILVDQLNPVLNDAVVWDTIHTQRGADASLNVANGQITIPAGRTFQLFATLFMQHTAAFLSEWAWYDVTNSVVLPGTKQTNRSTTAGAHNSTTMVSRAIVAPSIDTIYELRCTDPSTANVDIKGDTGGTTYGRGSTYLEVLEIGAVQANVVGGLEFMDIIEVTADTDEVTFGATGDGLHQRALDGDVDEEYVCSYYIPPPGVGSFKWTLRPNGLTANQHSAANYGGASNGGNQESGILVLLDQFNSRENYGTFTLLAKTGQPRFYTNSSVVAATGGSLSDYHSYDSGGMWNDTSTNVTSLVIGHNTAGNILKAGARLVLWRRTKNNLRADSASTYERNVEAVVAQGTAAEVEYTTGHATYAGCVVGVGVSLNDVVTAGTITVNVKVAGATKLTAVLDTTNTTFARDLKNVSVAGVTLGDEIIVGIATSGLTTTGGASPGITVNTTLVNYSLLGVAGGFLGTANTYTKAQVVAPATLTWGANIAMIASASNVFNVTLTGATAQLDNPSDLVDGQTIVLRAYQDVTGGRALTFDTAWDFGEDGPPDLTAEAGDKLSIITGVSDGTKIAASAKLGFTP